MKTLKTITYILALIAGLFMGLTCQGQSFYSHKTNKAIVNCESIEHGHNIVFKAKTKKQYRQKRKAMELFTKGKKNTLRRKGSRI